MLFSFGFSACSEEEEDYKALENKETTIKVKIYTNSDDAPVYVTGGGISSPYLIVKGKWENTYNTKNYFAGFEADCEDEKVLLTGELYVNGKLKIRKQANRWIKISSRVKGKGY